MSTLLAAYAQWQCRIRPPAAPTCGCGGGARANRTTWRSSMRCRANDGLAPRSDQGDRRSQHWLISLTSIGQRPRPNAGDGCSDACLTKPAPQSPTSLHCLRVSGRSDLQKEELLRVEIPSASLKRAKRFGNGDGTAVSLIAEDKSSISQFAIGVARARPIAADVVANGREAVRVPPRYLTTYGRILIDCQHPDIGRLSCDHSDPATAKEPADTPSSAPDARRVE